MKRLFSYANLTGYSPADELPLNGEFANDIGVPAGKKIKSDHYTNVSNPGDLNVDLLGAGFIKLNDPTKIQGTLEVSGATNLVGATVANEVVCFGDLSTLSNMEVGGTFGVTGITTLSGTVNCNGQLKTQEEVLLAGLDPRVTFDIGGATNKPTLASKNQTTGSFTTYIPDLLSNCDLLTTSGNANVTGNMVFEQEVKVDNKIITNVIEGTAATTLNLKPGTGLEISSGNTQWEQCKIHGPNANLQLLLNFNQVNDRAEIYAINSGVGTKELALGVEDVITRSRGSFIAPDYYFGMVGANNHRLHAPATSAMRSHAFPDKSGTIAHTNELLIYSWGSSDAPMNIAGSTTIAGTMLIDNTSALSPGYGKVVAFLEIPIGNTVQLQLSEIITSTILCNFNCVGTGGPEAYVLNPSVDLPTVGYNLVDLFVTRTVGAGTAFLFAFHVYK